MFRAAGPDSSGINSRTGIKAGVYVDLAMDKIPSFEDIGTPGTQQTYSRELLEDETLFHLNKYQRTRTGWISTTSSLLRALQILFIEHREQGQLFVLRTAACKDMFSTTELRDCLPGLKNNQYLRKKSPNEFLIRGKVEEHAIVGCVTVESLQDCNLDIIAPGLSNLRSWKQKQHWDFEFTSLYPSYREVSDEILDAAVVLAIAFDMKDKPAIVKKLIGLEFRIYSEGLDDNRVLDRIKEGTVPALAEALRNLCRASEEFTQALKIVIQVLEKNTRCAEFVMDEHSK